MEDLLMFKEQLIREVDHQGRTPLYYAASNGDQKASWQLLKLDRSIAYVSDKDGDSPIHVAAKKGHTKVIKEVIHCCPDAAELINLHGRNALHCAILCGQVNIVKCILEVKELEGLINQADFDGNTPLHLAAMEQKDWILCYLIWDKRVNWRTRNNNGQTALDIDSSLGESCLTISSTIRSSIMRNLSKIYSSEKEKKPNYTTQTYMKMGQTLLVVATLIATVTFSAAFTMPGGFNNNEQDPRQGLVLLQSNMHLKWFIISDTIAMTCSITAACLLFWGAVISRELYAYYFIIATILTYIALQSTAIAFMTALEAVMPNDPYIFVMAKVVGIAFHASTFLLLVQLLQMFSVLEACQFLGSQMICQLKSKMMKLNF